MQDRIRMRTKRTRGDSLAKIIADLNPTLRGWFNLKYARKMVFFDMLSRRAEALSFANSEISRQPQTIDLA